jgi:hypothetical protein
MRPKKPTHDARAYGDARAGEARVGVVLSDAE